MKELVRRLQKDGELTVNTMDEVKAIVKAARAYDKKWNIKNVDYGFLQVFKNSFIIKQINLGY